MSIPANNWAYAQQVGRPSAKLVLITLADHADAEGKCWPSFRRISARTELSRDTVIRSIRLLASKGFITVVHRHNGVSASSNMYYLNFEAERVDSPAECSLRSPVEHSSKGRPSYTNCTARAIATSDNSSSTIGTALVAPSDPNRQVESSKEASNETKKETFSLSKDTERDESLIQYDEAKQLLGKLSEIAFGDPLRETEWPGEMEELLKQGLPCKRQNWELIDWFYRLPADHKIFTVTYRRQSLWAVVQNLRSEPQKIRSARQAIELDGFLSLSDSESLRTGWTVQLRSAAREEFPDLVLPERYDMVAPAIQQRIGKRIAMFEAGWTRWRVNACKIEFPAVAERVFDDSFESLPWHMHYRIESRAREIREQELAKKTRCIE